MFDECHRWARGLEIFLNKNSNNHYDNRFVVVIPKVIVEGVEVAQMKPKGT